MPAFGLEANEQKVWDLAFTQAESGGYFRVAQKNKVSSPLAATAFAAGFMGGAFLGQLPSWINEALEPEVRTWIKEGHVASKVLDGQYIGQPYEANRGDLMTSSALSLGLRMSGEIPENSDEQVVTLIFNTDLRERWRPALFYPGVFVSDQGRVRDWRDFRKPRISESHVYPHVEIPYGGSKKVHELVAEAWLGPRPKGHFICHYNDNKLDARLVNLRYDTPKENIRDRMRNRRERLKE